MTHVATKAEVRERLGRHRHDSVSLTDALFECGLFVEPAPPPAVEVIEGVLRSRLHFTEEPLPPRTVRPHPTGVAINIIEALNKAGWSITR